MTKTIEEMKEGLQRCHLGSRRRLCRPVRATGASAAASPQQRRDAGNRAIESAEAFAKADAGFSDAAWNMRPPWGH